MLLPYLYIVRYPFWHAKTSAAFDIRETSWTEWSGSGSWLVVGGLCSCSLDLPTRRRQICSHSSHGSWTHWSRVVMRYRSWITLLFFTRSLKLSSQPKRKTDLSGDIVGLQLLFMHNPAAKNNFSPCFVTTTSEAGSYMLLYCMCCCVVPALGWILIKDHIISSTSL